MTPGVPHSDLGYAKANGIEIAYRHLRLPERPRTITHHGPWRADGGVGREVLYATGFQGVSGLSDSITAIAVSPRTCLRQGCTVLRH